MKTAFIFTGQGSQSVGMGQDIYENIPIAKEIFDNASEILEKDIKKICFEGVDLDLTINTQPAILTTEIALLESFKSKCDIKPSFLAGHSLGEYSALFAADVLNLENTVKLISKRAELMSTVKGGKMAAVLGNVDVESIIKKVGCGYVDIANYNCTGQVVITGEDLAVEKASEMLLEAGAKRVIPLNVSGAFHSKLMKPAGDNFEIYLKDFELNSAKIPVITNVDAEITTNNFKEKMPKQIYSSVLWQQSIEKMIDNYIDTFIEIGPAKILSGMNKKINSNIKTYNIFDMNSLEETIKELSI